MKKGLLSVIIFGSTLTYPAAVSAQATFATYGVDDWRGVVPGKRVEFQTYRTIVLTNTSIDDEEKARRVAAKYAAIEAEVRKARIARYEAVERKVAIGNSAIKGNSGGSPKVVDAKCRGADLPDMYTRADWARGAYKSGDDDAGPALLASGRAVPPTEIVASSGNSVCAIGLKQSGRGRKASYSEATFRIRPGAIATIVDAEMTPIMAEVSKSPV